MGIPVLYQCIVVPSSLTSSRPLTTIKHEEEFLQYFWSWRNAGFKSCIKAIFKTQPLCLMPKKLLTFVCVWNNWSTFLFSAVTVPSLGEKGKWCESSDLSAFHFSWLKMSDSLCLRVTWDESDLLLLLLCVRTSVLLFALIQVSDLSVMDCPVPDASAIIYLFCSSVIYLVVFHLSFIMFVWSYWKTIFTKPTNPSKEVREIFFSSFLWRSL